MPLYDYRCQHCGHEMEVLQSAGDERLTECPECKTAALKKLVSAPAFTFKGEGWYKDLYGKATPKKEDKTAAKPETKKETTKPKETATPK